MYFSIPRLDTYHNIIFHRAWHKTYQLFSWLNKDENYSRILKSSRRILQLLISTTNIHNVIVNSAFILKISYLENISATMYTIFSSDEPKLGFECRKLKKSSIMSPMLTKSDAVFRCWVSVYMRSCKTRVKISSSFCINLGSCTAFYEAHNIPWRTFIGVQCPSLLETLASWKSGDLPHESGLLASCWHRAQFVLCNISWLPKIGWSFMSTHVSLVLSVIELNC
jgi:hypothetical protein